MSRRTITATEADPAYRSDNAEICASQHISTPVFQELAAESIYLVGSAYGVLLTFADPNVAFGAHTHSVIAKRLFSRAHRSLFYVSAHLYGSPEDVATICAKVNRQHDFIRGAKYDANDPELQLWVAACIFQMYVTVHETFIGKMERSMRETLCLESAVLGVNMNMPGEMWFKSIDEFDEYFEHKLATAEIGKHGRDLAQMMLYGVGTPWYLPIVLWWAFLSTRALVVTWLPPQIRKDFGLPDPNGWLMWLTYNLFVYVTKTMYFLTPRFIRQIPTKWLRGTIKQVAADMRRTGRWTI